MGTTSTVLYNTMKGYGRIVGRLTVTSSHLISLRSLLSPTIQKPSSCHPPPFLSLHFTSLLYLSPRLNILPLPLLRKSFPYRATAKRPWRIEETRRPFSQRGENTLIINHVSISPPLTGHAANLYGRGPGHPPI